MIKYNIDLSISFMTCNKTYAWQKMLLYIKLTNEIKLSLLNKEEKWDRKVIML